MERFKALIKRFGETIGIPDLDLDEDGYCCLEFDGHIVNIEFAPRSEEFFFYACIADLPETDRQALCEMLLEANFFFRGTHGATFGIDKPSKQIILAAKKPIAAVDGRLFESMMEDFVNATIGWKQRLAAFQERNESEVAPENGFSSDFLERRA
ncbi:conserved hypothetical protein [uncultured Desulfatiglans sp.]|nr:conserved hypothetical protein [uncultured Desulfatiglans sp.]